MFNIKYSQKAFYKIETFINSYKNIFKKIYSDTGIDDEDLIIRNYYEIGDRLYKNIKNKLEEICKQNNILGKSIAENKSEYIIISLNNFRLFVYYKESIDLNERYIEDIEFFKK